MSSMKFVVLEIPQDEALLYKSESRVEVSSEVPQNILFCSHLQQEQNLWPQHTLVSLKTREVAQIQSQATSSYIVNEISDVIGLQWFCIYLLSKQQALRNALLGNNSSGMSKFPCWLTEKLWREEKLFACSALQRTSAGTELPRAGLLSLCCVRILCNAQGCCPCSCQNLSSEYRYSFSTVLSVFQMKQWWLLVTGFFFTAGISVRYKSLYILNPYALS